MHHNIQNLVQSREELPFEFPLKPMNVIYMSKILLFMALQYTIINFEPFQGKLKQFSDILILLFKIFKL